MAPSDDMLTVTPTRITKTASNKLPTMNGDPNNAGAATTTTTTATTATTTTTPSAATDALINATAATTETATVALPSPNGKCVVKKVANGHYPPPPPRRLTSTASRISPNVAGPQDSAESDGSGSRFTPKILLQQQARTDQVLEEPESFVHGSDEQQQVNHDGCLNALTNNTRGEQHRSYHTNSTLVCPEEETTTLDVQERKGIASDESSPPPSHLMKPSNQETRAASATALDSVRSSFAKATKQQVSASHSSLSAYLIPSPPVSTGNNTNEKDQLSGLLPRPCPSSMGNPQDRFREVNDDDDDDDDDDDYDRASSNTPGISEGSLSALSTRHMIRGDGQQSPAMSVGSSGSNLDREMGETTDVRLSIVANDVSAVGWERRDGRSNDEHFGDLEPSHGNFEGSPGSRALLFHPSSVSPPPRWDLQTPPWDSSRPSPASGYYRRGSYDLDMQGDGWQTARVSAKTQQGRQSFPAGVTGLVNLGNTCYMNSALQCLSNTAPLTLSYFLCNRYHPELNRENPLGMKGMVAEAYGGLLKRIWLDDGGEPSQSRSYGSGSARRPSYQDEHEPDVATPEQMLEILRKQMCNPNAVTPRNFKSTISRFQPSFAGFHQHDSQELLSFLLDGLHEDLNRVHEKPYHSVSSSTDDSESCSSSSERGHVPASPRETRKEEAVHQIPLPGTGEPSPTSPPLKKAKKKRRKGVGKDDSEVSARHWNLHLSRNDSVIVDLFHGQYKSTVKCLKCGYKSTTFDPFMYLSVPIPRFGLDDERSIFREVVVVPLRKRQGIRRYRLRLPRYATVRDLRMEIARKESSCEQRWQHYVMVTLAFSRISKVHNDRKYCSEIREAEDLLAYESEDRFEASGLGYAQSPSGFDEVPFSPVDRDHDLDSTTLPVVFSYYTASQAQRSDPSWQKPGYLPMVRGFGCPALVKIPSSWEGPVTPRSSLWSLQQDEDMRDSPCRMPTPEDDPVRQADKPDGARNLDADSTTSGDPGSASCRASDGMVGDTRVKTERDCDRLGNVVMWKTITKKIVIDEAICRFTSADGDHLYQHCSDYFDIRVCHAQSIHEMPSIEDDRLYGRGRRLNSSMFISVLFHDRSSRERVFGGYIGPAGEPPCPDIPKEEIVGHGQFDVTEELPFVDQSSETETSSVHDSDSEDEVAGAPPRQPTDLDCQRVSDNMGISSPRPHGRPGRRKSQPSYRKRMVAYLKEGNPLRLYHCLDEFTKPEHLSASDSWYCRRCKTHRPALKRLQIWRLPRILVVHLKRFRNYRRKEDSMVDFPMRDLKLDRWVLSDRKNGSKGRRARSVDYSDASDSDSSSRHVYDLYGVSNHFGGMGGGHYTAYAMNPIDKEWYNFDDSRTTHVGYPENSIKSPNAYLLFYARRDTDPTVISSASGKAFSATPVRTQAPRPEDPAPSPPAPPREPLRSQPVINLRSPPPPCGKEREPEDRLQVADSCPVDADAQSEQVLCRQTQDSMKPCQDHRVDDTETSADYDEAVYEIPTLQQGEEEGNAS